MTPAERAKIPQIRLELAQHGITPERWDLKALARGATVIYGKKEFAYPSSGDWPGFDDFT